MYVKSVNTNQIEIQYDSVTILCDLKKSHRKSYALEIQPGGKVILKVPTHPSIQFISQFLTEKEKWIKLKYQEQCELEIQKKEQGITVQQKKALEERYRRAAQEYIPKRVAFFQTFVGGSYERITIRDQKTRWGSCSSKGTLSFNWRLMLAPPTVLDYVVVHELCHLTHMNHSKEFWLAVEEVMPDYKKYRNWLKENGNKLQYGI